MGQIKLNKQIVIGGGCFWCIEAVFERVEGVHSAVSGYAGGKEDTATYKQVSTGRTDHAEVVKIEFNPDIISLKEILELFFTFHDPTQKNRQGNDLGRQYRSIIFYEDENQKEIAQEVIRDFEQRNVWDKPIVTELAQLDEFYRAEEYHQNYYARNPNQGYCRIIIEPKVAKLRQKYSHKLKNVSG